MWSNLLQVLWTRGSKTLALTLLQKHYFYNRPWHLPKATHYPSLWMFSMHTSSMLFMLLFPVVGMPLLTELCCQPSKGRCNKAKSFLLPCHCIVILTTTTILYYGQQTMTVCCWGWQALSCSIHSHCNCHLDVLGIANLATH